MRRRLVAIALALLAPTVAASATGVHLAASPDGRVVTFTAPAPIADARVSWTGPSGSGSASARAWPSPNADDDASYSAVIPASATSYQVEGRRFEPRALPAPGAPVRVAFVADWGRSTDSWAVFDAIAKAKPDLLIVGGDISYANGAASKWDAWLAHVEPLAATIPLMTAFGNHESLCADDKGALRECAHESIEYAEHFRMPGAPSHDYTFDLGPARFVALDTEAYHSSTDSPDRTDPDAQAAFATQALASAPASAWRIVYYHRSLYSSNAGQDEPDEAAREALEPIFDAQRVDLALSGHVHAYERSHPINGTVYVDSGGGGRSLYTEWGPAPAWSATRSAEFEFVILDVARDRIDVRALRPDGSVLDAFTLQQHGRVQETASSPLARAPGASLVAALAVAGALALARRRRLTP